MTDTHERELLEMLDSGETRWFARRRLGALQAHGLVAGSYWNPDLHPRGPDGKFIEKWGWVRWLVDGLWQRGQVTNLLPDGKVIVRPDADPDNPVHLAVSRIYGLPTPKGKIGSSPGPAEEITPDGWEKLSGAAGSNPGGFYSTTEPVPVLDNISLEVLTQAMIPKEVEGTWASIDYAEADPAFKELLGVPDHYVGYYTGPDGKGHLIKGFKDKTTEWDEAIASPDFKLWVTSSPEEWDSMSKQLVQHGDIESGTKFYVKTTKSDNHRANEVLANQFYDLAGVPVPNLFYGQHLSVASQILKSDKPEGGVVEPLSAGDNKNDPEILRQIRKNMAVDAWLANWDVAGMNFDNIMIVDGVPYRIDTGGSLQYRAMGSPKGADFGTIVGEMDSYLTDKNPSAAHVFKDVSTEEIRSGVIRIAAIRPKTIDQMVEAAGLSSFVAETLRQRRTYLLNRYGVEDPYTFYTPPTLTVAKKAPAEEMFWNPITDKWQMGTIKQSAVDIHGSLIKELSSLFQGGDASLTPLVGDLVVTETGLFRVESVGDGRVIAKSALQEDNNTVFDLAQAGVRVVDDLEVDDLESLYLRYQVASTNNQLQVWSLEDVFDASFKNAGDDKGALYNGVYLDRGDWSDLTDLVAGSFIFHRYTDPDGELQKEVFKIKSSSDSTLSVVNVLNGKERIITKDEWETDLHIEDWGIPDLQTQDVTLGLLKRDLLIDVEGTIVATLDDPTTLDQVIEPMENPDSTAFNTSPIEMEEVSLETLGVAESMTSEWGVNTEISTGEATSLRDLHTKLVESLGGQEAIDSDEMPIGLLDSGTILDEYVGQTVITSNQNGTADVNVGVWLVTKAEVLKSSGGTGPWIQGSLTLRSPDGQVKKMSFTKTAREDFFIQFANGIDASQPQPPWTYRADGALVLEGVQVGVWDSYEAKNYYGWAYEKRFRATIFPEHSITGKMIVDESKRRKNLTSMQPWLIPPPPIVTKKAKKTMDAIFAAADLKTKADFPTGTWVATPDGFVGKVNYGEGLPSFFGGFPSSVRVVSEDGKARIVNANLLVEIDGPEVATSIPTVTPPAPGKVGPYWPLQYGDGNDIYVGQVVTGGKGAKVITGKVAWVTPPGGKQASVKPYALVIDSETGKEIKKSLSILSLVEDVKVKPVSAESKPLATKAAVEVEIDFTPEQKADAVMKYVNPDGKTLAQPQWKKDKWLRGNPAKRTLTQDGYAPEVGMRMRTRDGKAVVIMGLPEPTSSQPNQVQVIDLSSGESGKRSVSALVVDHEAELGGPEGSLPYVSEVVLSAEGAFKPTPLPDGTVIYKAANASWQAGREVDLYFIIDEHGRVVKLTGDVQYQDVLVSAVTGGTLSKVAVIDGSSPTAAALSLAEKVVGEDGKSTVKPPGFTIFNPAEFTAEEALSGHFADLYAPAIPGSAPVQPIKHENLVNLPKPAGIAEYDLATSEPEPPVITGVVGNIDAKPGMLGGSSVIRAANSVLETHGTSLAGSAAEYGIGDHEYVEDLMVRSQIARDVDTGQEYVEFHFRMVEDKAEEAADHLLRTGKDTIYGKWVPVAEPKYASALKKGDAINVRVATLTGHMKPSNGDTPNVRLVADPEFLGVDAKGVKIYRVRVASASGLTGTMDIQERALPSVKVYEWNPSAIAQQAGTVSVSLTDKAKTAGWIEHGDTIGYDSINGDFSLGEDGTKLFNGHVKKGAATKNISQASYGRRLHRSFDDGSHIRFNAVPSGVSGTSSGGNGGSPGEIRRWVEAGHVTIRVPRELAETDPEAFKASVSRAMESVGIPPDRQGPASPEYLAVFALGKVYKTHASEFHHRQKGVVSPSMDDPGVTSVFSRMNKELNAILGRDLTFDDVQLHTMEDGRLVVLLSEEVGAAIANRQGNTFYTHRGADTFDRVTNIIGGNTRGLMGASERYSLGIFTGSNLYSEGSTHTDMTKGSGNRVYMSGRSASTINDTGAFIFNAAAVGRLTDIYVNSGDGYGNRILNNPFLTQFEGHEFMLKTRIDPGMMSYFIASDEGTRQKIIAFLKEKGVTEIGGRPIEKIVIANSLNANSDEFKAVNITTESHISVADLLASLGPLVNIENGEPVALTLEEQPIAPAVEFAAADVGASE